MLKIACVLLGLFHMRAWKAQQPTHVLRCRARLAGAVRVLTTFLRTAGVETHMS